LGIYITGAKYMIKLEFEGTDGAGKTTGLKYFIEEVKKRNLTVVETREVGNPNIPVCIKLRELVLSPDSGLCGEAMELVFSAMRYENDNSPRFCGLGSWLAKSFGIY